MLRLKKWDGAAVKRKFARYRLWFGIFSGLFLLTVLAEMIWFGAGVRGSFPVDAAVRQQFPPLAAAEGTLFLSLFLLGVTVYAPAAALAAVVLRGFASGYILSSLLPFSGGKGFFGFFLTAAYLLLSAGWFFAYAGFCTCVSFEIFSARCGGGGERLFGGTLFYAELFCGSVNLRFLFTYTLFFFAALLMQLLFAALYVLARTRLF